MTEPSPTSPSAEESDRWHTVSVADATQRLDTDIDQGLSATEAARRLQLYGPNALQTRPGPRWYQILARQFRDVLILILIVAGLVSFLVGETGDAFTILAIVALNGLLGFTQEWKAERSLEALKRLLAPRCSAVRDGAERELDARELVPGDVVLLEIGDRVPADLRLVESLNLRADESALTGESMSMAKSTAPLPVGVPVAGRSSMAWAGTSITNGRARGIAVATGMRTQFGHIAALTQSINEETTPLQRKLSGLGKQLGVLSIAISAVVATAGWALGRELLEMFLIGVSLAVAVVPEGLPAVVTITLALGVRAMVRRRALLRRLQAAEALGSASVICTDKTGTLTQNEMTVSEIWLPAGTIQVTGVGYDPAGHFEIGGRKIDYRERPDLLALLQTGLACCHAQVERGEDGWSERGEPTEAALVVAAYKAWLSPHEHDRAIGEFSFNSTRKRMTVIERRGSGLCAHTKGAPEVILERCTRLLDGNQERVLSEDDRAAIESAYTALARSGLRTLALARRTLPAGTVLDEDAVESDLTLLGVVGIIDPPRPEVPAAVRIAREAGVRTIMITGDAAATALAIAQRVGLRAQRAIAGSDLATMSDDALLDAIDEDVVFARTTPQHKLRIVSLLQRSGHVVGMTGDGVNDAPALKKADIGIAMGLRGTDVARGAADMVLTDDNFASIISAIEEGRRQYDNIQKFVRYLLSSNSAELLAILLNILMGGPLILLPVQILWMNLLTDGMTAVALGMEPAERGVMKRSPRAARQPILDRTGILTIVAIGTYMGLATLWLFHSAAEQVTPEGRALAQTLAFTGIIVMEKMNVFNFRSLGEPLVRIGFFSNPWVVVAWTLNLGLQACAVYVPALQELLHTAPLGWSDWVLILLVAAPVLAAGEAYKWVRYRRVSSATTTA